MELYRLAVGVLDEDEVPALASAAAEIANLGAAPVAAGAESAEASFRGGSLRIGVLVVPGRVVAYVQAGDPQTDGLSGKCRAPCSWPRTTCRPWPAQLAGSPPRSSSCVDRSRFVLVGAALTVRLLHVATAEPRALDLQLRGGELVAAARLVRVQQGDEVTLRWTTTGR